MKPPELTYIDLFAGAGGLSEGFIRQGFKPVAHVEMDANACLTLKTRAAYHYLKANRKDEIYYEYLKNLKTDTNKNKTLRQELYSHIPKQLSDSVINKEIDKTSIKQIFDEIDLLLNRQQVDVVIGGPPCQAYSLVGRARDPHGMKKDPRNYLYKYYAEFLKRYKPKMFVFENVTGLLSAENGFYFESMKCAFLDSGYEIGHKILNSENYGVLQTRKRVILVGWQRERKYGYPDIQKIENKWQVSDLLADLPPISAGEKNTVEKYAAQTSEYLKKFNIRNGLPFVTQHEARSQIERDLKIYREAVAKMLHEGKRLNYNDLSEDLKTHRNRESFLDRFKVVKPDGLSHTMVAHIAKDGHYYIYPDLKQIRSISIREAARIQSFPDDYYFEGGQTAAFRQIGNAVPPLMADAIAKGIKKIF